MLRLINFLTQYRDSMLLLLLLLISFYLVISRNDYQRHRFGDGLMEASGGVYAQRERISGFFGLVRDNKELAAENTRLREELITARRMLKTYSGQILADSLKLTQADSLFEADTYRFVSAQVIKNTTHLRFNYITIDKGARDGVIEDMGVISPEGIVGRVIRVSERFAVIQSALNPGFKLALKANLPAGQPEAGNIGFYDWSRETSPQHAELTFIPETVKLEPNQEVVTASSSTLFPEGMRVGTIDYVKQDGQDGFHKVRIKLAVNFNDLGYVYLIKFRDKTPLDSLELNLPRETEAP